MPKLNDITDGAHCPGCGSPLEPDGTCAVCVPISRMRVTMRRRPDSERRSRELGRRLPPRRMVAVRKDRKDQDNRRELPPGDRE